MDAIMPQCNLDYINIHTYTVPGRRRSAEYVHMLLR